MPEQKTILITGASSGLGKALALSYAAAGKRLILFGRNKIRLTQTANLCKAKGALVNLETIPLAKEEEIRQKINQYDLKYTIDLLIANAGISAGTQGGGESYQQAREIIATNILGVLNSIYAVIPAMQQRKAGQIVIISSLAAMHALPSAPAYAASKVCVKFLAEALRSELKKDNIRLNLVCPGYIKTPMTAVNKFPMPFIMSAPKAACIIKRGLAKDKARIIFPWQFYYLLRFVNMLPLCVSDLIFAKLPKK